MKSTRDEGWKKKGENRREARETRGGRQKGAHRYRQIKEGLRDEQMTDRQYGTIYIIEKKREEEKKIKKKIRTRQTQSHLTPSSLYLHLLLHGSLVVEDGITNALGTVVLHCEEEFLFALMVELRAVLLAQHFTLTHARLDVLRTIGEQCLSRVELMAQNVHVALREVRKS